MRCSLGMGLMGVAVIVWINTGAISAQTPSRQESDATESPANTPRKDQRRPTRPSPAARYSPLAASGGYGGAHRLTWYEAVLRSMNPANINWGARWETRRRAFLENWAKNPFFLFSALVLVLLILVMIGWVWSREDYRKKKLDLARRAAAARNYAEHWEKRATEAITKYNDHIERCNRVVEAGEVLGEGGDAVTLRSEVERLRTELADTETRNRNLDEQLQRKTASVAELSARVDEATRRITDGASTAGNGGPGPALVERINRLEEENRKLRAENRRFKGA